MEKKKLKNNKKNTKKENLRNFLSEKVDKIKPFASDDVAVIDRIEKTVNATKENEESTRITSKISASIIFLGR